MSDFWINRSKKRNGGLKPKPEYRLYMAYLGFPFAVVGDVIFFVTLAEAKPLHWIISPIIGIAIAGFGTQVITTVVITCELSR